MFLSQDILIEYCIVHATFGLIYVMFRFFARMFYGGGPGFATDRSCGVWCLGLCMLVHFLEIWFEMIVGL